MIKKSKRVLELCIYLFLAGSIAGAATQPLAAQVSIPEGSTINSAIFSVYVREMWAATTQTVNLHRIYADWGEGSVTWNSFTLTGYDPIVAGFFTVAPGDSGWKTVDLTALIQAWADGTYENHGFVMIQGQTPATLYGSSDIPVVYQVYRPKLEIWYTAPGSLTQDYAIIQRPDLAQDGVADSYIWQNDPTNNFGSSEYLYTGNVGEREKYSLLWFDFDIVPSSSGPGTGTPGYWMNHPEAWPVQQITIGGVTYTKDQAITRIKLPVVNDKTQTMFAALVAAKLNVLNGCEDDCIAATIALADTWMATYPSPVRAKSQAWRDGEPLSKTLDSYNNGELCAPARH